MNLAKPDTFFTRHLESGQRASLFTGTVYATGDQRMMAQRTIQLSTPVMDKPLVIAVSRDLQGIFGSWHRGVYEQVGLFGVLVLISILSMYSYLKRQQLYDLLKASQEAERKQGQDKLEVSEKRYRDLFEGANDGIFLLSLDGNIASINESYARMHGYSVVEMQAMKLSDLDALEETPGLHAERMRRLVAGESLVFEVAHYHKDGHIFPLEVSARMVDTGGEPTIQCFHRDITERKKSEEKLVKLNRDFLSSLENTTDFIYFKDVNGCFRFCSQAMV